MSNGTSDLSCSTMENSTPVLVPKGTVVQIGGFPAGLIEDTLVICGTMAAAGGWGQFKDLYLDDLEHRGDRDLYTELGGPPGAGPE